MSGALLAQVYTGGVINRGRAEIIAGYINKWKNRAGLTTRKDLAYFIGQIMAETGGLYTLEEGHNYTYQNIVDNFSRHFPDKSIIPNYVNCSCLFDKVYCCINGNGPESSHDGSKYSGKGLIQLTWKENYERFTTWYQNNISNVVSFVQNPELLKDDLEIATISSLWFFGVEKRKSTVAAKNIGMQIAQNNVDGVTRLVNSGMLKKDIRDSTTNAVLQKFCL